MNLFLQCQHTDLNLIPYFKVTMGNELCTYDKNALGIQSSNLDEILKHKNDSLSPKMIDFLERQKPYKSQLNRTQLTLKILGKNLYQGQLNMMGKPHGLGKLYKSDGSLFIGTFRNGNAHGMGYLIFPNGNFYQGFFVNGQPDDPKGKFSSQQVIYFGGYKNNTFQGHGEIVSGTTTFIGQFKNNKMAQGELKWKDKKSQFQCVYNGKFDQNQKFTGNSKLKLKQGIYRGDFVDGLKHGKGKFKYRNGSTYQGEYQNNLKCGDGALFKSNKSIKYQGEWKNDLPNGYGKYYKKDKNVIEGNFTDGVQNSNLEGNLFKTFQSSIIS